MNYAETSTYERELSREGFEAVPWSKGADVFLVNTCTVTEHSDKKSRNIIRKLHRQNPEALIFVTGCYAQLKKAEIEAIEGVTAVFGATEKSAVVPSILSAVRGDECCGHGTGTFFPAYSSGERTRSFLKVQDGCDYKCHYCTVPYARGESRNIPISEILPQAEAIAAEGIKEIVITGVNTGDFGRSSGETFFDLIKELDKVEGIERYRISSIEPNLLTEEMIDWITSGPVRPGRETDCCSEQLDAGLRQLPSPGCAPSPPSTSTSHGCMEERKVSQDKAAAENQRQIFSILRRVVPGCLRI